MITKQMVSRHVIFLLLLNTGFWTHVSFLLIVKDDVKKDDCSFNPSEFFNALIILEIVGNVALTISFLSSCSLLLNFDEHQETDKDSLTITIQFFEMLTFTMYFVCSIISNVLFFKADYLKGNFSTCSTIDSEATYRFFTFSFAWVLFIVYFYLSFLIVYLSFKTIWIAFKESNLFKCDTLKFLLCFSRCKRVTPIIKLQSNEKNIQTENEIFIPIASIKNEIKPFTCLICMNNMIDVIIKPCYHLCMCNQCYRLLGKKNCPCCNVQIKKIKNIYISSIE